MPAWTGCCHRHGCRRHYNYNSPVYQKFSARITEKFAEHYGKRSCIIGWQIDNELNCETADFHSESDSLAFREFLKEKYGTLDVLNEAWGTVFWNQTYTAWNEIFVPQPTVSGSGKSSPGAGLSPICVRKLPEICKYAEQNH